MVTEQQIFDASVKSAERHQVKEPVSKSRIGTAMPTNHREAQAVIDRAVKLANRRIMPVWTEQEQMQLRIATALWTE